MSKLTSNTYCGSYTDDDSGIGIDYDYSASSDLNSSTMTIAEPSSVNQPTIIYFPIPGVFARKRLDTIPLIKFPSDGIIERIRPATMKNSQNGDFIICRTHRGAYIARRTPVVPAWVTRLVHDIELQQK
jgi:hypothetical protein